MKPWDPTRALLHPTWWGALAVLVVNDHLLKGAGLLPGAVTGKLSDVAGLVVAPWVLAFLLRATTRERVLLAHVLVGAGFAGINLWPALARAVELSTSYTPFPWRITVDPTDVLTLPMLVVSFRLLGAVARREAVFPSRMAAKRYGVRAGKALAFTTGLFACVATSGPGGPGSLVGSLFVVSSLEDVRIVTTRALRPEVLVDCDFVAEDPTNRLSQDLFTQVQSWEMQPGDAVPLTATRSGCDAVLVGGGGAPAALVFWRDDELPPERGFALETLQESSERSIFLEQQDVGPRFSEHALRYAAPPIELPRPAEGCEAPPRGGIVWSEQVPEGSFVLDGVLRSPDGCYALDLARDGSRERFFLCLDGEELPFSAGELLSLEESGGMGSRSLVIAGESLLLEAARGESLVGQLESAPPLATPGCGGSFAACGSVVMPASVVVGEGLDERPLVSGAAATLSSSTRLYLATALVAPVRDAACDATAVYLESFSLREKP